MKTSTEPLRRGHAASVCSLEIVRHAEGRAPGSHPESVAIEEPLEIRIAGEPLATTMRTPGQDHELALGFLFAEGLIASAEDVGRVSHCGTVETDNYGNVIDVLPAPGTVLDEDRVRASRRATVTSAACGVCGRRTIEDLLARSAPLDDPSRFDQAMLLALPASLTRHQPAFARTGGVHAAGLMDAEGRILCVREDIGRHNAVDKVLGRRLLDRQLPARGQVLVVSGRASFEIVQKAVMARVPVVLSISAPSSLAIETAQRAGVTLIGFARAGSFNVYAHDERVSPSGAAGARSPD